MAFSRGLLLVAGSFAAFRLLNRGLERLVPPPPSAWRNRWKWRNIWTSLAHSVLSGGGALAGACWGRGVPWHRPSQLPSLLISSLIPGYFLEDFVDMLCHQKLHQSWELLFHHSVVSLPAALLLLHQYVGFALVALLVEINSIFLHLRQILLMADLMHTTCYRLNSIVNLGTYVVFRITTLAWMAHWLFLNRENVPPATYAVGTVGWCSGMTSCSVLPMHQRNKTCVPLSSSADILPVCLSFSTNISTSLVINNFDFSILFQWSGSFFPLCCVYSNSGGLCGFNLYNKLELKTPNPHF
uniref:TLC domain-containing protein n=1 Tax=Athene cunicularia TaxID=194338 RepID=A0A663MK40_ATHCN